MQGLLVHLVLIGLVAALDPTDIITFIAVISSAKGVRAGWAFLSGWFASLAIVSFLTWTAASKIQRYASTFSEQQGVRRVSIGIEVLIGVALLVYSVYRVRHAEVTKGQPSRITRQTSNLDLRHAVLLGALLPPWPLIMAASADVIRSQVGAAESIFAISYFAGLCTAPLAIIQLWSVRSPETSLKHIQRLRGWLEPHAEHIVTLFAVLAGAWLLMHAASQRSFVSETLPAWVEMRQGH